MKFKAGDKVRIVKAEMTLGKYKTGDEGVIEEKTSADNWYVRINGYSNVVVWESEMELIEMNRLAGLKLKFDVTDNPELSAAIQRRVFELGGRWVEGETNILHTDYNHLHIGKLISGTLTSNPVNQQSDEPLKLAILDDLYHLPKPKAKIVTPDGTEIELSDETWESMRESLK